MNPIRMLQQIALRHTHNILSETRARALLNEVTARLATDFSGRNLIEALEAIQRMPSPPDWLLANTLVHETFFFRHPEQYEVVREQTSLLSRAPLNILCLGCSTGQEPYSLAMLLANRSARILAVDVDSQAIQIARNGRYSTRELERTPSAFKPLLTRYLEPLSPGNEYSRIQSEIRATVEFQVADVFNVALPPVDLIFIRNSLIYFSDNNRRQLLERSFRALRPHGLLFIGASELYPADFSERISSQAEVLTTSILRRRAA